MVKDKSELTFFQGLFEKSDPQGSKKPDGSLLSSDDKEKLINERFSDAGFGEEESDSD